MVGSWWVLVSFGDRPGCPDLDAAAGMVYATPRGLLLRRTVPVRTAAGSNLVPAGRPRNVVARVPGCRIAPGSGVVPPLAVRSRADDDPDPVMIADSRRS
jgi:hypothetical protein